VSDFWLGALQQNALRHYYIVFYILNMGGCNGATFMDKSRYAIILHATYGSMCKCCEVTYIAKLLYPLSSTTPLGK
jgi:hypothetical protein